MELWEMVQLYEGMMIKKGSYKDMLSKSKIKNKVNTIILGMLQSVHKLSLE